MTLKEILQLLNEVAKKEGTSPPFIVGGAPRDKLVGNLSKPFSDIDITTGDSSIFQLAKEFSIQLKKHEPLVLKQSADGHFSIFLTDIKLDFSSNFNVPNIEVMLKNEGISNPTDMQKEIYSRDFNCNTLLMSLDFSKIKDVSGNAIPDIKNKVINTCLDPELTFKFNTNRIIRSIYLSAKLGFRVADNIIDWISKNPRYLAECETAYLSKNIDKSLEFNTEVTVDLINEMNLWKYLPITKALYPYYLQNMKESIL